MYGSFEITILLVFSYNWMEITNDPRRNPLLSRFKNGLIIQLGHFKPILKSNRESNARGNKFASFQTVQISIVGLWLRGLFVISIQL